MFLFPFDDIYTYRYFLLPNVQFSNKREQAAVVELVLDTSVGEDKDPWGFGYVRCGVCLLCPRLPPQPRALGTVGSAVHASGWVSTSDVRLHCGCRYGVVESPGQRARRC